MRRTILISTLSILFALPAALLVGCEGGSSSAPEAKRRPEPTEKREAPGSGIKQGAEGEEPADGE